MSGNERVRVIGHLVMFLMVSVFLLAACGDDRQDETSYSISFKAPEQANYETVQVEKGEYVKTVTGSAEVYYPVSAELCREENNAFFREILVKKGQEVKKGEVLATFDIDVSDVDMVELSLALTRATEKLEEGKIERLEAIAKAEGEKKTRQIKQGLSGRKLRIAELGVEKLRIQYEQYVYQAESEIAQLKEQIAELREELENNTLVAPFDGIIDSVSFYHPGNRVEAGRVLITMHATDRFYIVADDNGKLCYNMEVIVNVGKGSNKKSYEGKVVAAGNILPASVPREMALIQLYEDINSEELNGLIQYQCKEEVVQSALVIDRRAVETEDEKSFVYILEEEMSKKRYIVPGKMNPDTVWVLDGLSEGQTVILD